MAKRIIRNNLPTDQLILEAALRVLEDEGHGGFSIPKVAAKAGVFQGNVTYYYPNRDALISALAELINNKYREQFQQMAVGIKTNKPDWAETYIAWLVDDAISPKTARVFPELWSMSNAYPEIAKVMDGIYEEGIRSLIIALGHDPKAPNSSELWRVLRSVAVAIEGTTAIYGRSKPSNKKFLEVKSSIVSTFAPQFKAAHKVALKK
ncbi:MAG: hypothetical protein RL038_627 [Actinomycetota bacterium]|jgi:AcrR family transcriptional regulator